MADGIHNHAGIVRRGQPAELNSPGFRSTETSATCAAKAVTGECSSSRFTASPTTERPARAKSSSQRSRFFDWL
jgi:hypothetical protein